MPQRDNLSAGRLSRYDINALSIKKPAEAGFLIEYNLFLFATVFLLDAFKNVEYRHQQQHKDNQWVYDVP